MIGLALGLALTLASGVQLENELLRLLGPILLISTATAGALFLAVGVVIALVGIVKSVRLLAERTAMNVRMEEVEKRLDTLDRLSGRDWVSCTQTMPGTF